MNVGGLVLYILGNIAFFWILNKILTIANNRQANGQFKRKIKLGGMENGHIYL